MTPRFFEQFEFFAGVPDSQLKPLCSWLMDRYGISSHHIIAANEGNAVALAAGYHLATGKIPVVYLQNSGIGNIINPVASLLNEEVYGIPCVFVVGWRGEPGVHDEPQHVFQGKVTLQLLKDMDIATFIIGKETTEEQLISKMGEFRPLLAVGKQVAFLVRKGALEYGSSIEYSNKNVLRREEIIDRILDASADDIVVCTTGKASRELYERREARGQGHAHDFLTVGSMGHSSSIALGIALQKRDKRVWAIDGDGAALMHMGAMAVIGACRPDNLIHVVINNGAHESVGGMPTVTNQIDLAKIAESCGYPRAVRAADINELGAALEAAATERKLCFIDAACAIGAREDLGRPTKTPQENKADFMNFLSESTDSIEC